MTLESLELLPRGNDGWGSGQFRFGKSTTLLLGPGGAGKTPIIKTLAYALGHPVALPTLVREKVRAVRLEIRTNEGTCWIERLLTDSGVEAVVKEPDGATTTFTDERTFSAWMLPKLGIPLRPLSGKNGEKLAPYMSVVGPMFLVDQDTGWTNLYVPMKTSDFVKDQREEVIRWLLDVPAKNRPIDKSEFKTAKVTLAGIEEQIAFKRRGLEALQAELREDRASDAARRLEERRAFLETELARRYLLLEGLSQTDSALDVRVQEALQRRDEISYMLSNAIRRKNQLSDVRADVNAELSALEQNEIAADAFRSFCGNEACQFFRKPEESYGRRVLYLKDQLKDFEMSVGQTERELEVQQQQLASADVALQQAIDGKKTILASVDGGEAVAAVQAMTKELAEVGVRLDRLTRIAREREQLDALINKSLRASEDVAELKPTGSGRKSSPRLLDACQHLTQTFKEWMIALHTPNTSADVNFDEDFRLTLDGERFAADSSYSGGTRTRIVLAFHAAVLQSSLLMQGGHPRLLVLDAPRQHELAACDLRSYIERFHQMSGSEPEPVQLVFSAIEPEIIPEGSVDAIWEPGFSFDAADADASEEKRRFLGPPSRRRHA